MTLTVYHTFNEISTEDWQALEDPRFPFTHAAFLRALENSRCLGERTGWHPCILGLKDDAGLCAALITFVKNNSYGEYIFDFAWAQAFQSTGLQYYPKLVSAVPFTPATGSKFLFAPRVLNSARPAIARSLLSALEDVAEKVDASSEHFLFIRDEERSYFDGSYFLRDSFQYHWQNDSYQRFEDFLTALKGKRRREILRERAGVAKAGLRIRRLSGQDLQPRHAQIMYDFYCSTTDKMGGMNYLTREFFAEVFNSMKDNILFVLAEDADGRAVAGALNFFGQDTLYGRNWGCLEDFKFLHFEVCYYQGIEFAIEKNFRLFEAGAQGEHKFQRGFLPQKTFSAHRIHQPQLEVAIRRHVEYERSEIEALIAEYQEHSPFRREDHVGNTNHRDRD